MRILFLNQYFPPDSAPTGVLFGEIADALRVRGHEITLIDAGQEYRGGQGKGGRMRRELGALARMLWRGLTADRPDVVIAGSSPPCLLVVAQIVAARHRARSVHWCMDLYPDIAVALGEVREGSLSRIIRWMMGWAYRRTSKVVALDADMAERLQPYRAECALIRPWVFEAMQSDLRREPGEPWTWLYSGNLGRAHEWETLLAAQALLERRGVDATLIFQGGGPSWAAAKAHAESLGLKRVEWRSYVAEDQLRDSLLAANVLIVTERPEVRGMLWPSKLAKILTLPRPVLFVGPTDGAIANELRPRPHAGIFAPGDASGVAAWVSEQRDLPAEISSEHVVDASVHRRDSLSRWVEMIESLRASRNR